MTRISLPYLRDRTPGDIPRPLEKPHLPLGSEQPGSARGRLGRTRGCPETRTRIGLHTHKSWTLEPSRGRWVSGRAGDPKKPWLQQQVPGNPLKAPGTRADVAPSVDYSMSATNWHLPRTVASN